MSSPFQDQTTDLSGRQTYRLCQLIGPPDFVKTASGTDLLGEGELPPHVFADPTRRLYPCHTKAATWLSAAFFFDQREDYPPKTAQRVEEALLKLAEYHGLGFSVKELAQKLAKFKTVPTEEALQSLDDDSFGLVVTHPDGSKERRYPLRNGKEVQAAAGYLLQYRDRMPYAQRQQMAERILQKASQHAVALPEQEEPLQKLAGHGACSAQDAGELIFQHVQVSRKGPGAWNPVQVEMLKLAKICLEKPSQLRAPGSRLRLAETVDAFDREFGLTSGYGEHFPRPEEVLFGLTGEKMASFVRDNVETTTGRLYTLGDLERIRIREIRDHLGDDYADNMTSDGIHLDSEKAATVLKTMPRPDAQLFDRLCDEVGLLPCLSSPQGQEVSVSLDFLRQQAQQTRGR